MTRIPSLGIDRRRFLQASAAAGTVLVIRPTGAFAQSWPEKPITIVVMYAPGGGTDTIMRVLGEQMAASRDWNVEIQNKPGAVGGIATNYVLTQPSDGYTILGAANFNKFVRVMGHSESVPWKDWAFLQAASSIASWSVPADSDFKTYEDMKAWANENPGQLTISTSGTGGVWHEAAMILGDVIGIKPQFIPYKGGKEAALAGLQGETLIAGGGVHEHIDLIRDGQLRCLFHAGRSDITLEDGTVLPSIATLEPETAPLLPIGAEYNFIIPRDTPIEVIREISAAFQEAANSAAFKEIAEKQFFEMEFLTGEEADKKAARLEATTVDIFNRYKDQIGAEVKTAEELGLPAPAEFENWWPPEGYQPLDL